MKTLAILASFAIGAGFGAPLISVSASNQQVLVGKARATDGDSLRMGDKRIRLFGIDAVESAQKCQFKTEDWACGRSARKALEVLTRGQELTCVVNDMDRGRYVASCSVDGVDINRQQVRNGWAVAYTNYSTRYLEDEVFARAQKKGIWRASFERPHDYRARLRRQAAAKNEPEIPPSTDCLIKGNVSRSGTKIYHSPGQRDYKNTRINESSGERWFCTKAAAEAAGWRAAKR